MVGIENLAEALKEAAAKRQFGGKRAESKADRIRNLKREIAALRAKSATWEEIAEILGANGLSVSPDTIRKAILAQGAEPGPRRSRAAAPTSAPEARKRGAQPVSPADGDPKKFGAAGRQF